MESKNIIIIFAWTFLILLWVLSFFGEWDLFWPLILSFIVLFITIAIGFTPEVASQDKKVSEEIKDLKTKLESTAKDIEEIKKIIEE
jgi:ABC-type bacteriocin/lantibiotic exporter with double-glycine peptidase domain